MNIIGKVLLSDELCVIFNMYFWENYLLEIIYLHFKILNSIIT